MTQPVERLATSWMVQESNPDVGEIFRNRPHRHWDPPPPPPPIKWVPILFRVGNAAEA
jgi:hypothetical protein